MIIAGLLFCLRKFIIGFSKHVFLCFPVDNDILHTPTHTHTHVCMYVCVDDK